MARLPKKEGVPKEEWGPGEWQDEPDDLQVWTTTSGLKACAIRNEMTGTWCGYVVVPPTHPWWEREYTWCTEGCEEQPKKEAPALLASMHGLLEELDRFRCETYDHHLEGKVNVHGGVTYTGRLFGSDDWLIGFDCAHCYDYSPGLAALMAKLSGKSREKSEMETYKTLAYVKEQCEELAVQVAAHALDGLPLALPPGSWLGD